MPFHNKFFFSLKSAFKKYNFTVLPVLNKKLNYIIKLGKDRLDKWDETNVVYEIHCNDCDATYVGQTKRNLKKRIDEHKKTPSDKLLPIPSHVKNNNTHSFSFENVKILDKEKNRYKRLVSESFLINMNRNNINRQEDFQFISKQYARLKSLFNKRNS